MACCSGQRGNACSKRFGKGQILRQPCSPLCIGLPAGVKGHYRRNTISENVEGKQADLFEEIGIDLDETVGVDYKQFELLMPKKRKR